MWAIGDAEENAWLMVQRLVRFFMLYGILVAGRYAEPYAFLGVPFFFPAPLPFLRCVVVILLDRPRLAHHGFASLTWGMGKGGGR